jgi:IS1 family transposase
MVNHLRTEKKLAVLGALVEGCSVRSTERLTGVHRDTIIKFLVRVGTGCAALLDTKMVNLGCERLELDELWSFVGKKQRRVKATDDVSRVGDMWTYVAIDATSKLIPSFLVGKRDAQNTNAFVSDVAARMRNRVQISTDGLRMYVEAVNAAFGDNVDYAEIVKSYEADAIGLGRYSPPKVSSTEKTPIVGEPISEYVSTSYIERSNLNMRMGMRRFTRSTNAFSKKLENHMAAVALYVAHYNFVRTHRTLRVTPAVAAGVEAGRWDLDELLAATEERAA